MRIAIISDSHDNLTNIYKALDWINKNNVQEIIHCGDVCAPSALREIAKNFKGKIHLAYGNVDGDHEGMERMRNEFKNIFIYGNKGELKIIGSSVFPPGDSDGAREGKEGEEGATKIAFCHFPFEAKKMAESGKYDFVFYGHTHKPWEEMGGKCKMLNPGTLAGMFYKATFAVWDVGEDKFELKLLERL